MVGALAKDFGIRAPGFRLPAETRLGAVRLQVGDLSRSVEYYEHVLGMRAVRRTEGTAALTPKLDDRVLIELHARTGARPVPAGGALGLYHFAILLPDRASLGQFVAHLRDLRVYAAMSDHGVSEAVYLTDPDGLGIEVYADRPRASWEVDAERQLVMTTMPLDVRSLVKAGADKPWTGLPAGTVVGHVHLHVGDLGRAETFYHAALGFDKVVWSYPGALFLSAGGYHHHLGTNTWSSGAAPSDDQVRLLFWEIVVPDAEAVVAAANSLRTSGYPAQSEGDTVAAVDPWGTQFRIRPVSPISFL
jgi:catechol 2,3-dioxygenase